MNKRPTKKECIVEIKRLLRVFTSTYTAQEKEAGECSIYDSRNPYSRPCVKSALSLLAREQGINSYLDADIK